MVLQLRFDRNRLDHRYSGRVELFAYAFFYWRAQHGYRERLSLFVPDRFARRDWESLSLPGSLSLLPHNVLLGNNDELLYGFRDMNLEFWPTSCYDDLKRWFLRPTAAYKVSEWAESRGDDEPLMESYTLRLFKQ